MHLSKFHPSPKESDNFCVDETSNDLICYMFKEDDGIAFKALSEETEPNYRLVANVIGRRFLAPPKPT